MAEPFGAPHVGDIGAVRVDDPEARLQGQGVWGLDFALHRDRADDRLVVAVNRVRLFRAPVEPLGDRPGIGLAQARAEP